MLQAVHAEARRQHEDKDDEDGGYQGLPLGAEDLGNDVQGIIVAVDAEQAEYPDHTDHAERHGPAREHDRQEVRKEGQEVDDPAEGKDVAEHGPPASFIPVEIVRGPEPQQIVHCKKGDGQELDGVERGAKARVQVPEGLHDADRQIQDHYERAEEIVAPAYGVFPVADLYDLKYPVPEILRLLCHAFLRPSRACVRPVGLTRT